MISPSGIIMHTCKVAAITNWPITTRLKEVQSFLGFANFYRRFINGFSSLVQPLILLTRKDAPFIWSSTTQSSFDALKEAFLTAQCLSTLTPQDLSKLKLTPPTLRLELSCPNQTISWHTPSSCHLLSEVYSPGNQLSGLRQGAYSYHPYLHQMATLFG